jgi:hypothetical protein
MKPSVFMVFSAIVTLLVWKIAGAMGIPVWAILLIGTPLLILAQMYVALRYNSRSSLALEDVPENGYEKRLDVLEVNRQGLLTLGFQKTDEFYLKMACDIVTYVHQHESEPVYVCDYHLGNKTGTDLVTHFENDITLTTCTLRTGGTVPRPPKSLLQIIDNRSAEEVFYYHQRAIDFIKSRGISPRHIPTASFRDLFMQSLQEFFRRTRSVFWPVKLMYWHFTGYAKIYAKPIQEQYLAGMIKIF